MPFVTVGHENGHDIDLFFEDRGAGRPVVLIHGFPLDGTAWERQGDALRSAGYRVVTYDRRGFGRSSRPDAGYDYGTFVADLHTLLEHLDLRDAVLVGHSMGTGEVTRYLATHGTDRAAKGVLVSSIPPYILRQPDNPEGLDQAAFDAVIEAIDDDRFVYTAGFYRDFFQVDDEGRPHVSKELLAANFQTTGAASAQAMRGCVTSWLTDFRGDVAALRERQVPMLLIHGTEDVNTPIANTGDRLPALLPDLTFVRVDGAAHGICWTHADTVNEALLAFVAD